MTDKDQRITPRVDFRQALANQFDLSGLVAWVPGGTGGLGEAISWSLALAGAGVVLSGRDAERLERLAGQLREAGLVAHAVPLDATDVATIPSAAERIVADLGRLDILVNCVGIQREEPMLDVTEEAFDAVYSANLKAAMFLAQAAARQQVAAAENGLSKTLRQVHLLSVRSQLGLRDRGYSAYASTKGGLVMLVKQHAMELARFGITVNGIAPTFVYTEMIDHVMKNEAFRRNLYDRIPLGRIADPVDVAGPTLFFCAPASGFVTGQILYVDGGITASQ